MQLQATLRHYSWVIRRYFPLIGLAVLVCTCATAGISLCLPPVYQASALIMVSGSSTNAGGNTDSDIYSNQALAFSYSFLVTKDDVLQAAVGQLPGMTVGELNQDVSDSPITNTPMIEIRAQAADPRLAALIANVIAKSFIRIQLGKVSANLQDQDNQLAQRLKEARAASDAAQAKLNILQANHASASVIANQRSLSDTYQASYAALLDSYHNVQALELQIPNTLSISQLATPPAQPVGPPVWLNAGVAASLSLVLAVVYALLRDWLDETIKTEEDIVRLTVLNPLGSVPCSEVATLDEAITRAGSPEKPVAIARSVAIDEAFIAISSALLGQCHGKRAIMVTSLRSACGTSTVAANLALSLTRSGRRVLLIDANLRRPVLHASGFQFFHSQSLVHCLAELRMYPQSRSRIVSWLDQWRTCTPYLWLLPAGPIPTHPASLLSLPEVGVLVQELLSNQAIDLLLLDCAALDAGADALALATAVDAAVLVIEASKEKKEGLNRAYASLRRFNASILGVIINRWHNGLRSYFYAEHVPHEYWPEWAGLSISPSAADVSLAETQRLPAHIRAVTSGRWAGGVAPAETTPPFVRIAPASLPVTTTELSGKAPIYRVAQARASRMIPARQKGIIMPARIYDLPEGNHRQSL